MIKLIIQAICEQKRQKRIVPAIATSIEIQRELIQRGVKLTPESWQRKLARLEADPDVVTRRLLRYNGYELRNYANDTEDNTESISTSAKGA